MKVRKERSFSGEKLNAGLMHLRVTFATTDRHNMFIFFQKSISSFMIE